MKHLRRIIRTATVVFAVLSVIFFISLIHHGNHYAFACFITFLTCFYHFGYRLLVYDIISGSRISYNYRNKWFAPKSFEEPIFKLLRVKRWKEKLPNLLMQSSSSKEPSTEALISQTCSAELIHEINIVLSFVPFIISLFYSNSEWIFLLTGLVTSLFDLCFVIFHRHFRPRLIKAIPHN